ncbi:MAG: type II toxin-antitoxin system VapC family toxin [Methylovulum miyakonense]|uniref:type II toxin-antitoxin system VapC family toxin n=1 Tax=Methylovulum miyakonense TaxID=645578 RepID=UPI003BB7E9C2
MKAFLDTSSLLKLYHQESDTEALSVALAEVEVVYLSELARLEFCSAIWKKVRTQEINSEIAAAIIDCFNEDYEKFSWIKLDTQVINQGTALLNQYGTNGLRTLDAIQLSSALRLKANTDTAFFTHDKLLKSIFEQEGLGQ